MKEDTAVLTKACLLKLMVTSLVIMTETYANMVFLSSYPPTWIPYLYIAQGIFAVVAMQAIRSFVMKHLYKFVISSHIVFILCLLPFIFLFKLSLVWVPFVFAVLLLTVTLFINTSSWIVITSVFNLREFKKIGKWVGLFSTLGAIITGLAIPLIIRITAPIALLYLLIIGLAVVLYITCTLITRQTKGFEEDITHPTNGLRQYPLYINMFAGLVLMIIIFTFADFGLKSQLAQYYDQQQIGSFLAPLYATLNVFIIISQVFFTTRIIKRFSVVALLLVFPASMLLVGIGMISSPTLLVAVIVFAAAAIARYGFYTLGNQMLINVFPGVLRNLARFQLKSIGRNLGMALAALLLLLLNLINGLTWVGLMISLASLALFCLTYFLRKNYEISLKRAINLHHFDSDYMSSEASDELLMRKVALQALRDQSEDIQLFGLNLLQRIKLTFIPRVVFNVLDSDSVIVRIQAIDLIQSIDDPHVLSVLKERLAKEKNSEVIWHLIDAVMHFDVQSFLPMARTTITHQDPCIKASAICVLIKGGDVDDIVMAQKVFQEMSHHSDPRCRYWACRAINTVSIEGATNYIIPLINDNDPIVAKEAIKVAANFDDQAVISAIVNRLGQKKLNYTILKSLARIGGGTIPNLVEKIKHYDRLNVMISAVSALAEIPSIQAEKILITLLDQKDSMLVYTCIKRLAFRAVKDGLGDEAREKIYELIRLEVLRIQQLQLLYDEYLDKDIRSEIAARRYFSRKKYLYLLAAYTQNNIIMQLMPTLLPVSKLKLEMAYHKAIELLDISIKDRTLAGSIAFAFENEQDTSVSMPVVSESFDPWLAEVIDYKKAIIKGESMNEIEIILILRKVALFDTLSAESLQSIAQNIKTVEVAPHQVVFEENDIADGLYIVAKGCVVMKRDVKALKRVREGDFFGELALLDSEPRSATAVAEQGSLLLFLEKSAFNRLTEDLPEVLSTITQTILGYLRHYISKDMLESPE